MRRDTASSSAVNFFSLNAEHQGAVSPLQLGSCLLANHAETLESPLQSAFCLHAEHAKTLYLLCSWLSYLANEYIKMLYLVFSLVHNCLLTMLRHYV